jgi:hypothetical protein
MVCFKIDRTKCFASTPTSNDGITSNAEEYRNHGTLAFRLNDFLSVQFRKIGIKFSAKTLLNYIQTRWTNRKLKKYF